MAVWKVSNDPHLPTRRTARRSRRKNERGSAQSKESLNVTECGRQNMADALEFITGPSRRTNFSGSTATCENIRKVGS
ncbi:Hypothetical protein FKW44_005161 [Caligus rogercresseyi]|uniref:Uncharacterized protein n=1 Tax=Caligus rogercresseyi TaxID=217165 RepID=A0A7T8QRT0_CALRO|nr:Hypothetical protein FKW44_005161 [Caligus rogercresseyi]